MLRAITGQAASSLLPACQYAYTCAQRASREWLLLESIVAFIITMRQVRLYIGPAMANTFGGGKSDMSASRCFLVFGRSS